LRREWSPQLIETYGTLLGGDDIEARLRRAEGWLDAHPNDASLLLTLGRMCVRLKLWGKANQYLQRSLALAPSAGVWEALGDTYAGQGDARLRSAATAMRCCSGRNEAIEPLPLEPVPTVSTPAPSRSKSAANMACRACASSAGIHSFAGYESVMRDSENAKQEPPGLRHWVPALRRNDEMADGMTK
jgi:tetratricopeptide (TPR) repeat protein